MTVQLHQAVDSLRCALEAAGLDPSGLDLDELAAIKLETEAKIARYRTIPDFGTATPVFFPPDGSTEPGGTG